MNNNELAMLAAKAIDSKKGIDIKIIDIAAKSSFADCLIVASGSNDRQVGAIAEAVKEEYEKINIIPRIAQNKNVPIFAFSFFNPLIPVLILTSPQRI